MNRLFKKKNVKSIEPYQINVNLNYIQELITGLLCILDVCDNDLNTQNL